MAAKLAFWEAAGIPRPFKQFEPKVWQNIEIERKKPGPPALRIANSLKKKIKLSSDANILISLTHERKFAMAVVLIED